MLASTRAISHISIRISLRIRVYMGMRFRIISCISIRSNANHSMNSIINIRISVRFSACSGVRVNINITTRTAALVVDQLKS